MYAANAPLRVLIADDHPIVREGLAALLHDRLNLCVAALAQDGQEALALYRQHVPNVTLMNVRMPHMDGIEATRRIRQEFPRANIVMLSAHAAQEAIYQSFQAGARAYLLKNASVEELRHALHEAAQERTYLPLALTGEIAQRLTTLTLSPRELEILQQLAQGKSNQEIAAFLFIAEGTVKAHVHSVMGKLGVSDRTQAVITALKRGLVYLN